MPVDYKIPWDNSLNTGIQWIDKQHIQLLRNIENMLNALANKESNNQLDKLIYFLTEYVKTHFRAEQKEMLKLGYSKYNTHLMQHREFDKKLKEKIDMYTKLGASHELALEIEKDVWGWYKGHICKSDKDFASFLKSNDIEV